MNKNKKITCKHCGSKDGYHKLSNCALYVCNNCEKVV